MKTALVTGATGFIGSKLVEILLNRGFGVRGMSRNAPSPPQVSVNSATNFSHFQFYQGSITDLDALRRAMDGVDYVFHLAAYAKNWAPFPETFTQMNVEGMRNVFQLALEFQVQRIVWTSSVVTFGPTKPGETRDENTFPRLTETFFTQYERTKFLAEREALDWVKTRNLPLVIVNPARVYGPGQLSEGNAVSQLLQDYIQGKAPFLPNRGVNVGNYGFVDDVALGHLLALEKGKIGERYILGGENVSLRGLFELVDEMTGKKHWKIPLLQYGPLMFSWLQLKRAELFGVYPRITPGWVRTFVTDWSYSCEKAKNELGYNPVTLRKGLEITLDWLQNSNKTHTQRDA